VQGVSGLEHALGDLIALARNTGRDRDPVVRRQLADAYVKVRSLRALGYKGFSSFAQGSSAPEHSYLKLATSEQGKALYELGVEITGAGAIITDPAWGPGAGRWMRSFFTSFATTIAGGSSEIQRNIIAERILGLPRG
jgi:alkylation response protein AidB-like acyl-CoA dehydrogenase